MYKKYKNILKLVKLEHNFIYKVRSYVKFKYTTSTIVYYVVLNVCATIQLFMVFVIKNINHTY